MTGPVQANYSNMRARSLSQFNDWPLYQEVLRYQLGQSVQPIISRLAARLEQARIDDVRILHELTSIYESAPRAKVYYDKQRDDKFGLPNVYRFETVLRMHRELLTIRDEVIDERSLSLDKLKWVEGIIDDMGWLSGNFGVGELASNVKNAVDVMLSRHESADLQEAGRILHGIAHASNYPDTDLSPLPVGFAHRLLIGGIELFARFKKDETIDEAMLGHWAKSMVRRRVIPDIVQSCTVGATIPINSLLKILNAEWKHYNEYLLRQYDNDLRQIYPEVIFDNYRYEDGDKDYQAIYNETWDAYDLIYGLESAAAALGSSSSGLVSALGGRLTFLTQLVSEYVTRLKNGEQVHSKFQTSTKRLSETPELEEVFILAKTLHALAPDGAGHDAWEFLRDLIFDTEIDIQDRGYMLWRMEELFDTTTPMGMHEYTQFSVQASSAHAIPMEPPIRRSLSECENFSERVARQWATREVEDLLRRIQDVEVAVATRMMSVQRLKRWGAAAEMALPVLEQFESALPDGFDIENDPLSSGTRALFKSSMLTSTILAARAIHGYIQSSMQMRAWG